MNRTLTLVLAATLVTACKKDNVPIETTANGETTLSSPADSVAKRDHSMVRFVNAINLGTSANVLLGGQELFGKVQAGAVTDYSEVASDLGTLTVLVPGDSTPLQLGALDQRLMDGNRYTVFLVSEDVSKNTLRIVRDQVVPDSGKAHVRVIHAAPGAPELDIKFAGATDELFSGVNFKSEAGFTDVEPATVTLEVRAAGKPRVLLRVPNLKLLRSTSTTVVISGAGALKAFTFVDAVMAPTPRT